MAFSDDDLYEMSDEELYKAFKDAKVEDNSPEDDLGGDELDLEQPEMDSDDDASSEEEVEVDTDEESEVVDDPEEELEETDEPTEEVETETDKEEQPVQKRKYKANGKDFEFTDEEIFKEFGQVFGQAMNYTQKMQQIKPWRKTIDAIEQAGLSQDDLSLAIDVLSGDKEAIGALLRRTGVDALEIDTDNVNYSPKDYGRNDTELNIREIVEEIKGDQEYPVTYDILERQWDTRSKEAFAENPELIRQLHIDVKSGMYDTLSPMANKLKVYDGARDSDLNYYVKAAKQYFSAQAQDEARLNAQEARKSVTEQEQAKRGEIAKVKTEQAQRTATQAASTKRKAAAPGVKAAGSKQVTDYLDENDEKFDEWYSKIQGSF